MMPPVAAPRTRGEGGAGVLNRGRATARSAVQALCVGALILVRAGCADAQQTPPEEPVRLPPVIVTAPARLTVEPVPLSSVPAAVDVMSGQQLREDASRSLQESLTRLPGVTVNDEQGNKAQLGISLRGFFGSSVTGIPQGISVFLDGVRVNEPDVEQINFDLLPMDDLERMELIRGPSAVFGRNTLAGSLNLTTPRGGPKREFVPELEVGSFGYQKYRLRASGTEGLVDYYFGGSFVHEDGWRADSESRLGQVFGKLGYRHSDTDATLSFQYANNRIEQAGSLPASVLKENRSANFTGGDFYQPTLFFGIGNIRQDLGGGFAVSLNTFGRHLDVEQFNVSLIGDNTRGFTTTTAAGGTLQVSHQGDVLGGDNRAIVGVEYTHHAVKNRVFEEKNDRSLAECIEEAIAAGDDPATACPLRGLSSDVRDDQHAVGAYVEDIIELSKGLWFPKDSLVLTVAGRWDWLQHRITDKGPFDDDRPSSAGTSTFQRFTPRIGLNYNFTPDTGMYVSYSQGFRAPAFLELTCANPGAICPGLQAGVAPDPPLKSVKADNYEVGFRTKPAPWLEMQLALFRTDVHDDIFSVSPTGTIGLFFQNIGETRRQGAEVGIRTSFKGVLAAYVNYSYTRATFETHAELTTPRLTEGCAAAPCVQSVRRGDRIPLIPDHRLNVGLDYHLTSWLTASLTGQYVGEQRLRGDEANEERPLPTYFVANAGLRAEWKALTAFIWVKNVFNNDYETFGTFAPNARVEGDPIERFLTPARPIHVTAGLSYRF